MSGYVTFFISSEEQKLIHNSIYSASHISVTFLFDYTACRLFEIYQWISLAILLLTRLIFHLNAILIYCTAKCVQHKKNMNILGVGELTGERVEVGKGGATGIKGVGVKPKCFSTG